MTSTRPDTNRHEGGVNDDVVAIPERETRKSLTILRVAADVYPEVTGGGAIHAHAMSKRQAARGHNVTLLTSDHGDRTKARVESRDKYTLVRDRELVDAFGNSITPSIVTSLRRRLPEADIVHAHSHLYFTSNLTAAIVRNSGTPLVVTNHGLVSQTAPDWVQRLFLPTVGRFTFNAANRVLCYTETDRRRLHERSVSTPVEVVRNGVDCQRFTSGDENEDRELLFVGRLTDAKGLPTLLDGFAQLVPEYPELILRVVGDGPDRANYERRARRLGVADRIVFVGDVPYEDVPQFYRNCTVFVLPSHNEGLPRTVLEAMACETPVVTTALPQLESLVAGAGYTVEKERPEALARAVGRLLDSESRRKAFGEAGRACVVERHSWADTVTRTTDVFYDIIN